MAAVLGLGGATDATDRSAIRGARRALACAVVARVRTAVDGVAHVPHDGRRRGRVGVVDVGCGV